jgi:hypothetical protein
VKAVMQPPNGLPFSCRKRCTDCQNRNDLVREAVGWNGGLGVLVTDAGLLPA